MHRMTSGCEVCATTGSCLLAFHNSPGKYCGAYFDTSITNNKPCCCPLHATCKVSPTQCMCHVVPGRSGGSGGSGGGGGGGQSSTLFDYPSSNNNGYSTAALLGPLIFIIISFIFICCCHKRVKKLRKWDRAASGADNTNCYGHC